MLASWGRSFANLMDGAQQATFAGTTQHGSSRGNIRPFPTKIKKPPEPIPVSKGSFDLALMAGTCQLPWQRLGHVMLGTRVSVCLGVARGALRSVSYRGSALPSCI